MLFSLSEIYSVMVCCCMLCCRFVVDHPPVFEHVRPAQWRDALMARTLAFQMFQDKVALKLNQTIVWLDCLNLYEITNKTKPFCSCPSQPFELITLSWSVYSTSTPPASLFLRLSFISVDNALTSSRLLPLLSSAKRTLQISMHWSSEAPFTQTLI